MKLSLLTFIAVTLGLSSVLHAAIIHANMNGLVILRLSTFNDSANCAFQECPNKPIPMLSSSLNVIHLGF